MAEMGRPHKLKGVPTKTEMIRQEAMLNPDIDYKALAEKYKVSHQLASRVVKEVREHHALGHDLKFQKKVVDRTEKSIAKVETKIDFFDRIVSDVEKKYGISGLDGLSGTDIEVLKKFADELRKYLRLLLEVQGKVQNEGGPNITVLIQNWKVAIVQAISSESPEVQRRVIKKLREYQEEQSLTPE